MISPTGNGIRGSDDFGYGSYGAPRGDHRHEGVDFIAVPGQEIVAPCKGDVIRIKYPYSGIYHGIQYSGLLIRANDFEYTLFYFEPLKTILKTRIAEGQLIGYAQDISLKYNTEGKKMIPHIHMQFDSINPELFIRLP